MGKRPQRLSTTLGALLNAHGLRARLSEYRILGQWEKSVGSLVANHARPVTIRANKLYLIVDSPAWMQQLSMLKPEIIGKVNRSLGRDAIKDLVLNLGELPAQGGAASEPHVPLPELTPQERETIEGYIGDLRDPDIRQALRRVIEKDFASKRRSRK
ncbi:MAG: hypothetical protein A2010_19055 [Nitrospirae bacterium GWD2_57_9]|nr:MAG: hypothetical protein A2010_19055 [Nitrospirae bacterium GWD2_57_9]OGW46810.1 MAG: hypothetical protein A2078_15255 [Nitrospirae bacterium GWC2_57_9]